jgi:trimeric autotransporter adhesin
MKYRIAITLLTVATAVAYAQVAGSEKGLTAGSHVSMAQSPATASGASSLPAAARAGISAALGREDRSYEIARHGGELTATNPEHELSAVFKAGGVNIRTGKADLGMTMLSYGYGERMRSVGPAVPQASANRVEYKRGGLTEWYENGPLGMEQGFTLAEPPAQKRAGALTIALALSGDYTASADQEGSQLTLKGHNQQETLLYGGLNSYDANGKDLKTWLEVHGKQVELKVEDAGAVYPVVVDPWVQVARLTVSNGAKYDFLGNSISVNQTGLVIVVGASQKTVGSNEEQGAVYVFVRPTKGWATTTHYEAELTNASGQAGDNFGASVAVSSTATTIVIGAPQVTVNGNSYQGAVYVFARPAKGWASSSSPTATLTASNGAASDFLGSAVAFDGVSAVAGAWGHTVGSNQYQGEAYVYTAPKTGWVSGTETAQLTSSDGEALDMFGYSVSAYNGTAVIGAPQANVNGNIAEGAAYVFVAPSTGWVDATDNVKLIEETGFSEDLFGFSVAISSDTTTAVVGAEGANVDQNEGQGAAYVFVKPSSGWSNGPLDPTAELTASDGLQEDYFGAAVSINYNNTTIAVGAPFAPYSNLGPGPGKVYTYAKPSGGWATTSTYAQELVVQGGKPGAEYGISVGTNTNTLAVGAICATISGHTDQGAVFVAGVKTGSSKK